jgi:ATP-dependent Zn protease
MFDFEMSKDKVLMGVERRSMILSDEEKRNTAYHEAGHALVAAKTPGADPLHKVTMCRRIPGQQQPSQESARGSLSLGALALLIRTPS